MRSLKTLKKIVVFVAIGFEKACRLGILILVILLLSWVLFYMRIVIVVLLYLIESILLLRFYHRVRDAFMKWFLYLAYSLFIQLALEGVSKYVKLRYLRLGFIIRFWCDRSAKCVMDWVHLTSSCLFGFFFCLEKGLFCQKTN